MGFFDWLGHQMGGLQAGFDRRQADNRLSLEHRRATQEQLRQQAARDIAAELEKQRNTAEAYAKNPEQFNSQFNPVPSWNEADQLALYDAYQRSGIDREKQAESDQAVLAADAFKRGLANITNEAALVNIGSGQAYKPVELEGGVFYNPYDTQNFNLGSTQKHQAETKLKQSEAAEQALRMANIRALKDPLMQINASSNKELGKPMEAEVEGPNGETHKALITQDSNGRYHHSTVTDKVGNPLVIPPEAVGGGSSGLTTDQKNVKYYSQLWGKTEAETAEILKSKSLYSDAGFIEERLTANSEGRWGRADDKTIFNQTFDDFTRARYGSYFPSYFETLAKSSNMTEVEKKAFTRRVEDYNKAVDDMQLAGKAPPSEDDKNQSETGTGQPETAITNRAQATQKPLWNLDNIQFQQQPSLQLPDMPAPNLAIPQTSAPATIPEQPEIPDFQVITETILNNNGPAEINAALKKQGFDVSPENMTAMAVDAVNRGENPLDIQQLLQLLGIQWTPPA